MLKCKYSKVGGNIKNHKTKLFLSLLLLSSISLCIGYAKVNDVSLNIFGTSSAGENGPIRIIDLKIVNQTENLTVDEPTFTDTSVDFGANFTINENDATYLDERTVTYEITLENDSIQAYIIGNEMFNPSLHTSAPSGETLDYAYELIGINPGDSIDAKTTKVFQVKLSLYPSGGSGVYIASVSAIIKVEEAVEGILKGIFKDNNNTGDLTGQNLRTKMIISIMNSNNVNKTINFKTGNSIFKIVDQNGNNLEDIVIPKNTENVDCEIYIERLQTAVFANSPQKFNIYITNEQEDINIGVAQMYVDVDESLKDFESPVITSLNVSKSNTSRSLTITWTATDNIGIDHYDLILYDQDNNIIQTQENLIDTSYEFQNLNDGTYYAKVTAYDGKNNSGTSSSNATEYIWTYSVQVACTNCTADNNNLSVDAGETVSITLTGNFGYNGDVPMITSVVLTDVTTNETRELNTNDYTYSNGTITINNVAGNITITAQGIRDGTCLVEGTKVLLANGQYKNIEDIDYNDLVLVWNHDKGSKGYEYPAWIEKSNTADMYTQISFSDGSILKVVGEHSIFSPTLNKYVTVNTDEFKVGIEVIKYNYNDNKIYKVTVTKIEEVIEKVNYYHIITTRYFNMFTNDILTTYEIYNNISNFPGFDNNLKWVRSDEINSSLYTKDDFPNVSNYIYNTFRLEQTRYLIENNLITRNELDKLLSEYPMSLYGIKKDQNNNNLYMVATSDYINPNNLEYLVKENSIFNVPYPKNKDGFKYWYNHSDNKIYYPNDDIEVTNSIYLEAIYN